MKRGPTIVVILLALVLAASAYFALRDTTPAATPGAPFLPGLAEQADYIASIEVKSLHGTVRLEKVGEGSWIVATSDGYPAKSDLVRGLIVSLGMLTLHEPMTTKPERHAELGLAWPDQQGRARRVRMLPVEVIQPVVADVILGEERAQPDTIYVRKYDEPETWRAKGRVQIQSDALGWIDRSLLALPRSETTSATLRGLTLTRPAEEPTTGRPPPWIPAVEPGATWTQRQIDGAQMALPSFLERLEFDGVRKVKVEETEADPLYSPRFETRGATVQLAGHKEAEDVWFTVTITPRPGFVPPPPPTQPSSEPPVPDYEAVAKLVVGWQYRMPAWKADALARTAAPDPPALPAAPTPPPGATEPPNK